MKIQIRESDGVVKTIGTLKGNIFRKKVKQKIHLYRKLDAWGIDAKVFKDVLLGQTEQIRILDTDENLIYFVDTKLFDKKGEYLHFPPHRAQIFLSRRYWDKESYKK